MTIDETIMTLENTAKLKNIPPALARVALEEAIDVIRRLRPFGFSDESVEEALATATAIRQENCWLVERRLLGQKDGWFWGGDRSVEEAIKAIRYTKDQAEAVAALLSVMYPTAGLARPHMSPGDLTPYTTFRCNNWGKCPLQHRSK